MRRTTNLRMVGLKCLRKFPKRPECNTLGACYFALWGMVIPVARLLEAVMKYLLIATLMAGV